MVRALLFVCSGNTCRSPMAAAAAAARLGSSVTVRSAGIECDEGLPAAGFAVQVMQERGIDLSKHESTDVADLSLQEFDLVVALDPSVGRQLARFGLKRLEEWDIEDPYGGTVETYRATANAIERALSTLLSAIQ